MPALRRARAAVWVGECSASSRPALPGHTGTLGPVLYLDRAAFVTGEVLHVDGGQAAGR